MGWGSYSAVRTQHATRDVHAAVHVHADDSTAGWYGHGRSRRARCKCTRPSRKPSNRERATHSAHSPGTLTKAMPSTGQGINPSRSDAAATAA